MSGEITIVSLHHKTHVAELWGKTGSAEDLTGSEIPGGYLAVIDRVLEGLASEGLHPAGQSINVAAPTSLWVSAAIQARKNGAPIHYIICPLRSLPWREERLVCVPVSPEQTERFMRNVYRDADYILHPAAAAAYYALQCHRAALGEATPTVILATESPLRAAERISRILGIREDLEQVIAGSRKRFLEY